MELYNDDCLDVLQNMSDNSIDCIVTDCPYHIVAGGNCSNPNEPKGILRKKRGGVQRTSCDKKWEKQDDSDYITAVKQGKIFEYNEIKFEQWLPEFYRVLKENSHCYIMINSRNLKELQQKAEKVGFKFQNLLVWHKNNATPSQYYMQCCEFILMLKKGYSKPINNIGTMNCFEIPNIIGNKLHPTEKSVELMKILVENSTKKGDVVLDAFMGSGSTGIACKMLERDFIGIEIDKTFFDIAKERIERNYDTRNELKGQLHLF